MKTVSERLAALRREMKAAGCDAYILPSSDPHSSEYAPGYYTAWEYFSGFSVENATLVVTASKAALWVDGRFFGAADAALKDTGIESMHMGVKGVPEPHEWLSANLAPESVAGCTAANMPHKTYDELQQKLAPSGISLKQFKCDDAAWTEDRPALPATRAWILDRKYAGASISEKLARFREKAGDCDAAVLTKLDSIAWLLNLRAADVEDTPYAVAFCLVKAKGAVLFIDSSRLEPAAAEELKENGVELKPYEALPASIKRIRKKTNMLVDPRSVNAELYELITSNANCTVSEKDDPVQMLKAVKNQVEQENTREAHIIDGAAMVRFQIELEKRLAAGEKLRETDIDPILHKYRSAAPLFIEESFPTIAAYGSNAAMMHYAPEKGKDAEIENKGFLLVDCGGTYFNGTTDITRTYAVGPLTDKEKEMYTLTLKSHADVAMAVWREKITGCQIDMLARAPFWSRLLDYRCGTGHSVSHVGAVHEGPHSLNSINKVEFVPGMIITDEPGYYEEGAMGIRIENELLCVPAGESEYGSFTKFEPITFVPVDMTPVIAEMLSPEEKAWINAYHAAVYEKISPLLEESEKEWLKSKCLPIE